MATTTTAAASDELVSAIRSSSSSSSSHEAPIFREAKEARHDEVDTVTSSDVPMNYQGEVGPGRVSPLDAAILHEEHRRQPIPAADTTVEFLAKVESNAHAPSDADARSDVSKGSSTGSVGVESSASTILHNNLTTANLPQPQPEGWNDELLRTKPQEQDSEASSSAMMDVPLREFASSAIQQHRPSHSLLIPKLTSESIESHLMLQKGVGDNESLSVLGAVAQGGANGGGGAGGAAGSEVLSTASEMGTVIEMGGGGDRMAQVEDVLLHHQQQQTQQQQSEQKQERPPVTPKSRNNYYERMFDGDDDNALDADRDDRAGRPARGGLALPRLDGTFHVDEKKVSEGVSSTVAHVGGMPRDETNNDTNNATSILSRTMKRFSSNLLSSSSAPNTPRSSNPRPSSRKAFAASERSDDPPAPEPVQSPWSPFPATAAETPTSFLLRSPGSSARMAAKRQHRTRRTSASDEATRTKNDLLLPRFGNWTQRRDDTGNANPPTGTRTPPPAGVHASLVKPPPQLQPPSSSGRKYSHVLARACFSFDAYDTCVDHLYEVPAVLLDPVLDRPKHDYDGGDSAPWASSPIAASTARAGHARYPTIPERSWESSASTPTSAFANSLQSLSPLRSDASRTQPLFRTSSSWDAGSTPAHSPLRERPGMAAGSTRPMPGPFAFRPTRSSPSRSFEPHDPALRHPAVHRHRHYFPSQPQGQAAAFTGRGEVTDAAFLVSPPRIATSTTPSRPSSLRNGFMPSPHHGTPRPVPATPSRGQPLDVLASPQRLEMEREDALDILACLVERGVTLKNDAGDDTVTRAANGPDMTRKTPVSADSATLKKTESMNSKSSHENHPKTLDLALVVESLLNISSHHPSLFREDSEGGDPTKVPAIDVTHEDRVQALEELLRSHEYAMEMKRVSQSASSWLQSIGRKVGDAANVAHTAAPDSRLNVADEDRGGANLESGDDEVDLLTAKAMLHSACVEIEERAQYAEMLNVELAKCRAEIGRLKSAANASLNASFRSPNRSILDVSEELSPTSSVDRSFDDASPIPGKDDSQFLDSSFEDIVPLRQDRTDLAKFQAALEDANEMIRKLHGDLKLQAQGKLQDCLIQEDPPVVLLSDVAVAVSPSTSKEEHDADNYVTDWDELQPSLPPPPDHDLRSPIVETVLEQWSSDSTLRERLLEWMEQVLSGADPISIPPLTLSHLDNQVRDGFTTHVLPLLLRRPDIRVDVQTRAQRLTTYDLAVSVERVVTSPYVLAHRNAVDVRRHSLGRDTSQSEAGTDFATHSTVTALVSNKHRHHPYHQPYPLASTTSSRSAGSFFPEDPSHPSGGGATSRLSHDEMADGSVGPHHSHPGIMSALGGALGGLLSRRKGGDAGPDSHGLASASNAHGRGEIPDPYTVTPRISASDGAASNLPPAQDSAPVVYLDDLDDDEPYHRVVAAPPGRLGVTFVEYRGHAMVSDVAEDKSPLTGWIFPGDILIAIDELSVSGMRLRDVIQVLKDRGNRQRALRVISSHDMTELTLSHNTSAVMND